MTKKYPIDEGRVSHVHELMKHSLFSVKETVRCLDHSSLIEFSELDEKITSARVDELREIIPVLEEMVSTFSIMESLMMNRPSSEVTAWEVSDRVERISHTIFPSLFLDGYPPLESSELNSEKLKSRLNKLEGKHSKVISEARSLSFEYKDLCEYIRDGEYDTDERREQIEKEIEKVSKAQIRVNIFVDGEPNVIYVEDEETAEEYRGKNFTIENGLLKPILTADEIKLKGLNKYKVDVKFKDNNKRSAQALKLDFYIEIHTILSTKHPIFIKELFKSIVNSDCKTTMLATDKANGEFVYFGDMPKDELFASDKYTFAIEMMKEFEIGNIEIFSAHGKSLMEFIL